MKVVQTKLFTETEVLQKKKPYPHLSFALAPIVAILGKQYLDGCIPHTRMGELLATHPAVWPYLDREQCFLTRAHYFSDKVLRSFGWNGVRSDRRVVEKELLSYLQTEVTKIKQDVTRPLRQNQWSFKEYNQLILIGAELLWILDPGFSVQKKMEAHLEMYGIDPQYVPRYILNGWHERHWYEKTGEFFRNHFPEQPYELVVDFFAITSQNADIESNVAKALKALNRIKTRQTKAYRFKQMNGKDTIETIWHGFMEAQVVYLKKAEAGEFGVNGIHEAVARKLINFKNALMGNPNGFPLDFWMHIMFRGIDSDVVNRKEILSPTAAFYRAVYFYVRVIAKYTRLEPRQIQAASWVGLRSQRRNRQQMHYGPIVAHKHRPDLFSSFDQ